MIRPLLCAAGLLATSAAQAFCGFYAGKADASLFNEASQVVLVRDGQRTVISMLNDYKGPLAEFALVVPTPTVLQQGQVRVAEKAVFERLDAYSSPRLAEYHDDDPCRLNFAVGALDERLRSMAVPAPAAARQEKDARRDKALGVTVEVAYTLEEYDIVSLSATQSDGLETWLRENGYRIPAGASQALRPYIQQGMKFFVAKVNLKEQARIGYSSLRPLQFAFESDKFMLPMRLGMLNAPPGQPQDLIVYVLTRNGRVEAANYRTEKLPANVNLPPLVKPRFSAFYKAMFEQAAQRDDYRVVFTEYFWDMAWCDPCAANPLSSEELLKAGAFWVAGDGAAGFDAMRGAKSGRIAINSSGGAQPVVLTRLHLRYTPRSFSDDLMFTQTRDRQNWQARYVVQNPYAGSPAQCSRQLAQTDCTAMCRTRLDEAQRWTPLGARQPDPYVAARECESACTQAKHNALDTALRYYGTELPERLSREKRTLAQLTGWRMADIDAMAAAQDSVPRAEGPDATPVAGRTWWQRLFSGR